MVFVNKKLVKKQFFNTHAETILALKKLVKRQLYFLSLSLAFTIQLCAMITEGTALDDSAGITPGTVRIVLAVAAGEVPEENLDRIRTDVSVAIAGSVFATSTVIGQHKASRLRSFDTHLIKICSGKTCSDFAMLLHSSAGDASATITGRSMAGLPPKHPVRHQVRRRNADGSPTRARVAPLLRA